MFTLIRWKTVLHYQNESVTIVSKSAAPVVLSPPTARSARAALGTTSIAKKKSISKSSDQNRKDKKTFDGVAHVFPAPDSFEGCFLPAGQAAVPFALPNRHEQLGRFTRGRYGGGATPRARCPDRRRRVRPGGNTAVFGRPLPAPGSANACLAAPDQAVAPSALPSPREQRRLALRAQAERRAGGRVRWRSRMNPSSRGPPYPAQNRDFPAAWGCPKVGGG